MLVRRSDLPLLVLAGIAACAQPALAQVVATETQVTSNQARLTVEAVDDQRLEISFRSGEVTVNGERVGDYEDGGPLDRSWRALLRRVSGEDAYSIASLIAEWAPPSNLQSNQSALASTVDDALERIAEGGMLTLPSGADGNQAAAAPQDASGRQTLDRGRIERLLESLIDGAGYAEAARAIQRTRDGQLDVRIGEDVHIDDDETFRGTLVVVGADIEVEGEIDGDVILSDGTLTLQDSGRIRGDVHLLDARVDREGGRISGSVVRPDRAIPDARIRDQIREEIRSEIRAEMRHERRRSGSVLRNLGHGVSGIVQTAVQLVIMVALGMVLLHFAPDNMSRVAQVARDYPARSAAVGMAGFFLLVPVWLVGMVALAISIIGIPLLIAWVPLVPVAAGVATLMGCLAVALNLGGWVQRHDFERLRWARDANYLNQLILGVGLLSAAFVAAHATSVFGPWFGFFGGLLTTVGCLAVMATAIVGFGAVLLTRGGRQDLYDSEGFEFDWRPRWERGSASASAVADDMMDRAADVMDDVADAAAAAADDLEKAAAGAADEAEDLADRAAGAAKDAVGEIGEDVEALADDIADELQDGDVFEALDDEPRPDKNDD